MSSPSSKLFEPIQVGDITLGNRVVMAPLTRFRATETHVPGPHAAEYYSQRSVAPGTLLITEATLIGEKASGYFGVPAIYSDEQISGWKKVVDAVHANGSFIYLQLWALGRAADPAEIKRDNASNEYTAASAIPLTGHGDAVPRALTSEEIQEFVALYATAASNAVHKAGFDGVEIHGANGYLVDQFLQDVSNNRTDSYGGSVENRSRFALEVVKAVVDAVGEKKTALRLSPWSAFQDMGMTNPEPQFTHLINAIRTLYPDFAYLHVLEPRVDGWADRETISAHQVTERDALHALWAPKPLISAGGYDREMGVDVAQKTGQLVAYGRLFISNPDLVRRLKENLPLSKPNRATYYTPRDWTPTGYTDYPFAGQAVAVAVAVL
ncbi:FMN-linked oxidoreductase [Athelia psychrophila]|uniref:FMN-linked oxidoreductase n=1 Tax=Athelia psychrophila TaxID=1759441 RepID=A0A166T0A5_9AGAM|nr:FMN-linked oxidoreductase [Fibularhizoctonia sp. CBS 109695]